MIDILLVLLIIYMVVAPSTGLRPDIPQPASGESKVDVPVVVRISADRTVRINTEAVDWSKLRERFLQIFASRAEKVLFIGADRSVEFKDVALVVDTARGIGVDHVAFMPREK